MSTKKTSAGVCTTTSKLIQGTLLLLWILWVMFGYRSNIVRHAGREHVEHVNPKTNATPGGSVTAQQVTTPQSYKTSSGASVTKSRKRPSSFRDICWKPQCIALADIISDGLGNSTPCDDFFGYVCGHREENKVLQPSAIKNSAVKALLAILDKPKKETQESASAVGKFTAAYRSCVNAASAGNETFQLQRSLHGILRKLGFEDWLKSSIAPSNGGRESIDSIWKKIGLRPFFNFYVPLQSKRYNRTRTIIITKRRDSFLLCGASVQMSLRSQKQKDNNTARPVATSKNITAEQHRHCKELVAKIIELADANVTRNQRMLLADEILTLELTIAKLSGEARLKPIEVNMTSKDVSAARANLTLRTMLQKELDDINVTMHDNINVILEYPDYYTRLLTFINSVNSTNTLKNYVVWSYIRSLAEAEGTLLYDLNLAVNLSTTSWTPTYSKNDVRASCLTRLLKPGTMLSAAASLYINYNFNKYDRKYVEKMISFIKSSLERIILKTKWMTPLTKNKAAARLASMETLIGYPEWMLDNVAVEQLYRFIPLLHENASFAEHMFWIQENNRYQELLKLSPQYKKKEFAAVALFSHPFYIERTDTLVLPAAAIVPHYRRPPVPRALNFGTLGVLASMLMVNAIDRFDTIRTADYRGVLGGKVVTKDFWDQQTKENFCNYSSCLKNELCTDIKKYPDGQGETHLKDYLGLRVSFMALKNSVDNYTRPHLLRGADFNSEEKIFFLAFGNLYCPFSVSKVVPKGRADDETVSKQRQSYKRRLNGAVNGLRGFQKAFQCKANEDECKLFPQDFGSLN